MIHDNGAGMFVGVQSTGSEINGNVVYNNGWWAPDRTHGHGIYVENTTGILALKDNVVFNNFQLGFQERGQSADTIGVYNEGNVAFNNGSPTSNTIRSLNILIAANNGRVDGCTLTSSYTYSPNATAGTSVKIGEIGANNGSMTVTNNYFAGTQTFEANSWATSLTVTGNTMVVNDAPNFTNTILAGTTIGAGVVSWNNNTYYKTSCCE